MIECVLNVGHELARLVGEACGKLGLPTFIQVGLQRGGGQTHRGKQRAQGKERGDEPQEGGDEQRRQDAQVCPEAAGGGKKEVEHQSEQRQVGSSEEHHHYLGAVALWEAYPRQRCVGFEVLILQLVPSFSYTLKSLIRADFAENASTALL